MDEHWSVLAHVPSEVRQYKRSTFKEILALSWAASLKLFPQLSSRHANGRLSECDLLCVCSFKSAKAGLQCGRILALSSLVVLKLFPQLGSRHEKGRSFE